jgi:predicted amidohydrolase
VKSGRDAELYLPGNALPVFDTPVGRFGILICHDRAYAEAWRTLALRGAEAVLIPSCGSHGDANTCRLCTYSGDHGLCSLFAHPNEALLVSATGTILAASNEQQPHAMTLLDLAGGLERRTSWHACRRADLYALG